jgi:hypothetical protein
VGLVRRLQWPLAELWHALSNEVGSMTRSDAIIRRQVLKAGLIVAGVPFCHEALFDRCAVADDEKPAEDTPDRAARDHQRSGKGREGRGPEEADSGESVPLDRDELTSDAPLIAPSH